MERIRLVDETDRSWERLHPRSITDQDWTRFQRYMTEIFEALGMDTHTPGTERTPIRYLRALYDATAGYEGDPKLVTAFPTECRTGPDCRLSQVIEGPITFYSLCEHHALPFFGQAYVGYIAHEHIIGISKLTRLVRLFAARFSVQERIGQEVVQALEGILEAHGVAVYTEAVHLCTQMRGVRDTETRTRTTFWRGEYENDPELRSEFLHLAGATQTR
jgi:GTP cyclohydrolase I